MGCCGSKAQVHAMYDDVHVPRTEEELDDLNRDNIQQETVTKNQIIIGRERFKNSIFFSVGDIESYDDKMENIIDFIMANPTRDFIFMGDLIDNLSWSCKMRDNGLRCLRLLDENGLLTNGLTLNEITDFSKLQFPSKNYHEINNRVKFIIGNAERDLLLDIVTPKDITQDDAGYFEFGSSDMWFKKFTYDELALIYKYLSCCYGSIFYVIDKNKKLYIRHSWQTFKNKTSISINQKPKINPSTNTPILCGHNKGFGVHVENVFMNDTSLDRNDYRICSVAIRDDMTIEVESISLNFTFPGEIKRHVDAGVQCSTHLLLVE